MASHRRPVVGLKCFYGEGFYGEGFYGEGFYGEGFDDEGIHKPVQQVACRRLSLGPES